MLFKQAALGDERAFMTVKNSDATSITTGYGVMLNLNSASFDGTQALMSVQGVVSTQGFLGIAVKDIAVNAYGLVQIFGNCASVLLSNLGTSITIAAGNPLIPGGIAGGLFSAVPAYATSGFNWVIASNTPSNTLSIAAPIYCSGFVRCLK
jgi:hypothetical protein